MARAFAPDSLMMAIPPTPGAVAMAQMVLVGYGVVGMFALGVCLCLFVLAQLVERLAPFVGFEAHQDDGGTDEDGALD